MLVPIDPMGYLFIKYPGFFVFLASDRFELKKSRFVSVEFRWEFGWILLLQDLFVDSPDVAKKTSTRWACREKQKQKRISSQERAGVSCNQKKQCDIRDFNTWFTRPHAAFGWCSISVFPGSLDIGSHLQKLPVCKIGKFFYDVKRCEVCEARMVLIDWWNLPAMTSREILGFSPEEWQNKSANAKKHARKKAHLKIPTIIFENSSQNESGPADARRSWYTDIWYIVWIVYLYMIYTYILNLDISTNLSLIL